MQDRTINNALVALAKKGGTQGRLADVILEMRSYEWSGVAQDRPLGRGKCKLFVLRQLRGGPQTNSQLADALQAESPDITRSSAQNRCYQALVKLEDRGEVVRDFGADGCLWRISLSVQKRL